MNFCVIGLFVLISWNINDEPQIFLHLVLYDGHGYITTIVYINFVLMYEGKMYKKCLCLLYLLRGLLFSSSLAQLQFLKVGADTQKCLLEQ